MKKLKKSMPIKKKIGKRYKHRKSVFMLVNEIKGKPCFQRAFENCCFDELGCLVKIGCLEGFIFHEVHQ